MSDALSDILIFGAGFGTRMAPLTDTRPKPLIAVAGRPLIDHACALAEGMQIHVNAHYKADQLQAHLGPNIKLHIETPDILDTGGGLKAALPDMQGDAVFTLNSDAIWAGPNPLNILRDHWAPDMAALLLLVPIGQTVGYARAGNFTSDAQGRLARSPAGDVYTGAQIIRRDVVKAMAEDAFSLNAVWDQLLDAGTVFGVRYPGRWADVGTPQGIKTAEAMLADV